MHIVDICLDIYTQHTTSVHLYLDAGDAEAPLAGVLAVQHAEPVVRREGDEAVGEDAVVRQPDPGDLGRNIASNNYLHCQAWLWFDWMSM